MNGYIIAVLALVSAFVTCSTTTGAGAFLLFLPSWAIMFLAGYLAGKDTPPLRGA